jgi:hypothetical protein
VCDLGTMYRISRDNTGTTSCVGPALIQSTSKTLNEALETHERLPQAMLKRVHAEHSRKTHVRAMAMVMER